MTRLSPGTRRTFQVLGPLLVLGGLALWFVGIVLNITGGPDTGDSFQEFGEKADASFLRFAVFGFIGFVLLAAGGFMVRFGYMRVVSEVSVTEMDGAIEHAAGAVGRGLGRTTVKLRCRSCGGLDSEDARFCSSCGQPM